MEGGGGGVMNWDIGIDIYTLICIKWITNKNLLYKKIYKIKFKKILKKYPITDSNLFHSDQMLTSSD